VSKVDTQICGQKADKTVIGQGSPDFVKEDEMSRINTNMASLIAVHDMRLSQDALSKSLQRLSSGLQINTASDNPSGLIISELLRAQIGSINQAIDNSERAGNMIATSEGALNEVNRLLQNIRALTVEAANEGALTAEEIEANQLQIDSAVDTIARIANTTQFGGIKLLDGSLGYDLSGVAAAAITDVNVTAAQFAGNSNIPIAVDVTTAATKAMLITGTGISAIGASAVVLEIAGNIGTEVFTFGASTAGSALVYAVNTAKDVTGVSANLSGGRLVFASTEYGSDQFVGIRRLEGAAFVTTTVGGATPVYRDEGSDASASINGTTAVAKGNTITVNTTAVDVTITLKAGVESSTSFTVTGGGAVFQLGPNVKDSERTNVGIQSMAPSQLGRGDVGYLYQIVTGGSKSLVSGNAREASDIVDEAILDVASLRGRLGAFQLNTIETNISTLQVGLENVTAAESVIRDTDFAEETSALTRAEILVAAGTSVLATANAIPQGVLALLG